MQTTLHGIHSSRGRPVLIPNGPAEFFAPYQYPGPCFTSSGVFQCHISFASVKFLINVHLQHIRILGTTSIITWGGEYRCEFLIRCVMFLVSSDNFFTDPMSIFGVVSSKYLQRGGPPRLRTPTTYSANPLLYKRRGAGGYEGLVCFPHSYKFLDALSAV